MAGFLRGRCRLCRYWPRLGECFPAHQVLLLDTDGGVVAAGHSLPLAWDGTLPGLPAGWDAAIAQGYCDRAAGRQATVLAALAVAVAKEWRGQGLSVNVLQALRAVAEEHGFPDVIVPARPTWKQRYPLTPFDRYVQWTRQDGLPFDPWLRAPMRIGAQVLTVAPCSMVMTGTVAPWEQWTALAFPESGLYVVPGALQPVMIDIAGDVSRYQDPNLWLRHRAGPASA